MLSSSPVLPRGLDLGRWDRVRLVRAFGSECSEEGHPPMVVVRRQGLREEVRDVFGAGDVGQLELALFDAVPDPVEPDVDGLGLRQLARVLREGDGHGVVGGRRPMRSPGLEWPSPTSLQVDGILDGGTWDASTRRLPVVALNSV